MEGTTYTGVFFKTIEEQSSNTVVVDKGELTLADDGQVGGTLTAYPDSKDFPDDTLTISGTHEEGAMQGNKQSHAATDPATTVTTVVGRVPSKVG